jgi:hypothetical protein
LYFNSNIEQKHDFEYIPPTDDFTAIVTKRKDVFGCLCSHLVMLHTGEMSIYSHKEFSQFDIDLLSFSSLFAAHDEFYKKFDLTRYRNVVEIWFEDLISDPYYLFGQFNISEKTSYGIERSPNRYEKLVKNIDDVYTCYQSLSSNTGNSK